MMAAARRERRPGIMLGIAMLIGMTPAQAQSRFDTELQNLRALPPNFKSWCEAENLIFKSPSSARFRISKSALCAGKPNGYIVCAPGPASGAGQIPACATITAPGA